MELFPLNFKMSFSSSREMSNTDVMPLPSEIDEVVVCYLCLDGGDDKSDQPLRRDCACRGTDAGYVHLSCLTKYAASKSLQPRDANEFIKPWTDCPSCHQEYQNELRIDIATELVSLVRRKYPDNTQRQVEALHLKLRALDSMLERLQPVQKRELGVTAIVILSLVDRMKREVSPLPEREMSFQAFAHNTLGRIALFEGTEEGARSAVVHLENQLEVYKAIGFVEGIATAKSNIALAKSIYKGGNNEEVLKACQELYELRVAELGEEDYLTIDSGKVYAAHLQNANRGDEARELLTKLLATSKQVFGSDHNTTKEIESELKKNEAIERVMRFMKETGSTQTGRR